MKINVFAVCKDGNSRFIIARVYNLDSIFYSLLLIDRAPFPPCLSSLSFAGHAHDCAVGDKMIILLMIIYQELSDCRYYEICLREKT